MNRRWAAALFVLIFILASVNFVFWAEQREGYHCDELWSHGLANSTFHYEVFDESGAIKWNTAADYDAYMTVAKDGRFDYLGVYYNQMTDVHPPLFYAIMHTAASFFPGSASIYFCIIPNILFTLGSCVFVYLIAMRTLKKRGLSLLSVGVFCFSVNCINMVIYMRMYAQLTFFTTALMYLYIRLRQQNFTLSKGVIFAVAAIVLGGAYTQYYFFIFLFAIAFMAGYELKKLGDKKLIARYVRVTLVTAGIYVVTWPFVFLHIFGTGRGGQAFGNVVVKGWFSGLKWFSVRFIEGIGPLLAGLLLLSAAFLVYKAIKGKRIKLKAYKNVGDIGAIAFSSIFYFLVMGKIAPYMVDRYIAVVFPLAAVLLVYATHRVWNELVGVSRFKECIFAFALIVLIILGHSGNMYQNLYKFEASEQEKNYLYRVSPEIRDIFDEYAGKKCVAIPIHEWQIMRNLPDYKNYSETAFVYAEDIERLKDDKHLASEQDFVLYIGFHHNPEVILKRVKDACGFDSHTLLTEANIRNRASIYRIYKTEK